METLAPLFEEFISECEYSRRTRLQTLRGYRHAFSMFQKQISDLELASLTPKTLNEFFRILQTRKRVVGGVEKSGIADSTAATYWSKLNTFFDWLATRGHIETNPLRLMREVRPRPNYDDPKSLRKKEIEKIMMAIENHAKNQFQFKRDRAIFYTLLFTGIRKGELIGLKTADVDLERNILTVHGETSKSCRTRQITIHPGLRLRLQDYLDERSRSKPSWASPYLFVSLLDDNGLGDNGYKRWVERLVRLSGVKFHLHRFRHTFAMNLANKNVGDSKVQRILGHRDIRMTQRYLRSLTPEDMRQDINRLNIDEFM
jgi:integrase/recombinase XerD